LLKIEPNVKYQFSEPFRSQLERALRGHAPWKQNQYQARAMKNKPTSDAQKVLLRKLGYTGEVPESMGETSDLISKLKV
jgi:hypothetical protein